MQPPSIYRFHDIVVDPVAARVFRCGEEVAIEPKSLRVLLFLIENPNRLVSKEELMQAAWHDTCVSDNSLTRAVAQIRKSLGDDSKQARYVETVPRLGYRFIADITIEAGGPTETVAPPSMAAPARSRWRPLAYIAPILGVLIVAVAVSGRLLHDRNLSPALLALASSQLTTSPGLDVDPTFSPDGNSIAFSSDRAGPFEIFIKPLAPGARTIQVTYDGRQNVQPAWSPDGSYLAYYSMLDRGIYLIEAFGGNRRRITDFGTRPAWSGDGKWIAFHDGMPSTVGAAAYCGNTNVTAWIVPIDGGDPRRADPEALMGVCNQRFPSWTRDGRVLYVNAEKSDSQLRTGSQLWSVRPGASQRTLVATVPGLAISPVWSPDDTAIYYLQLSGQGQSEIRRLPLGKNGTAAGEPVEMAGVKALMKNLALSPDGKKIAYTSFLDDSRLLSLPISQNLTPKGPPSAIAQDTLHRYAMPAFSPDGRLAYTVWRKGSTGEIWMSDENGANATPVSSSVENGASAGWLPDASAIAFYRYLKTGTEMWTVSVADRVEKRISSFGADGMIPRLSPDGREIVFHTMRANISNLWKFDLASGASTQLTSSERDSMGFGVWSPDSKWIAFERSHGSDADLLIMPRGGGQFVQLTEGPGLTWPGSWTGDNGHVLAAAQRNAVWNLIFVSVIDKSQQQLTHYQSPGSYVRSPVLNPRGDLIVFEFNQTKGNVYIAALGR